MCACVCVCVCVFATVLSNWISPIGNTGHFILGIPTAVESPYPTYGAWCLSVYIDYRFFYLCTDINTCDCRRGCRVHWKVTLESHEGIQHASAMCRLDALPTELHPHPHSCYRIAVFCVFYCVLYVPVRVLLCLLVILLSQSNIKIECADSVDIRNSLRRDLCSHCSEMWIRRRNEIDFLKVIGVFHRLWDALKYFLFEEMFKLCGRNIVAP